MKKLKRLSTTISASFDSIINEFENQESIIKAAIIEIKNSKAILDVQQRKSENENIRAIKRMEKIKVEIPTWELRVKESYSQSPEMANDCSKRIILLEKELSQLENKIEKNNKIIATTSTDKEVVIKKLNDVEIKLSELKVKETKQNALMVTNQSTCTNNLNDVIDRWEEKLTKNESFMNEYKVNESKDELKRYFSEKEFEDEAQKKIQELIK